MNGNCKNCLKPCGNHTWCTCKTSNVRKHIRINRLYPVKFCGHCWCEDEKCAEKTESLIKEYQRFVTHASTLKKNQQPDSKNSSFIVLNKMIHDPIISAKFFKRVSHKLNAFLRGFQTDNPIIPFFGDVLDGIANDLLERIFLKDVLLKVTNLHQSSCF